ncbi:MAG: hypothetical protein ACJ73E_09590 [Mycobacteriales bacterium]
MDATTCPECAAPAEVTGRAVLASTDGPIEHVRVVCARRHWFLMSTATLDRARRAPVQCPAPVGGSAPGAR